MIRAYDEIYLHQCRIALGRMLDFAVYDMKYDITYFYEYFIHSTVAHKIESGNTMVIAGRSGVEMAYDIIDEKLGLIEVIKPNFTMNRSPEFWAGWVVAYYQWYTSISFKKINEYIPIKKIIDMYIPYHEMDIMQFVDRINQMIQEIKQESNIKLLRQKIGISQNQLSERSGVPLRTLQQYEQRQKNINRASAEYVIALARVLGCMPEELMEIQ